MNQQTLRIHNIPAILWGDESDRIYIHVHGKMSRKEYAASFAGIANQKGIQTLSFDLPEHGERSGCHEDRCDVWNGMRDLTRIADFVFPRWKTVYLYACSLGAYFSLNAYADRPFQKCLFQSPVVDMAYLIRLMFKWNGVTEEQLQAEREIETPLDTLRWDYYQYVLHHPIVKWDFSTAILYAGKDNLQSPEIIRSFSDRYGCKLTLSPNSEHPFMKKEDVPIVN